MTYNLLLIYLHQVKDGGLLESATKEVTSFASKVRNHDFILFHNFFRNFFERKIINSINVAGR